jgi:hypothetical protein
MGRYPHSDLSRAGSETLGEMGLSRQYEGQGAGQEGLDQAYGGSGKIARDLVEHGNIPDEDRDGHGGRPILQPIELLECFRLERVYAEPVKGLRRIGNDPSLSKSGCSSSQRVGRGVERVYGQEQ